jgi:DNA-repair protein XRCC2
VIEIQGPPASGKTHLLYHLIVTCILPSKFLSTSLGGWGKAAIVFDMDGSFDLYRLRVLLVSRIRRLLSDKAEMRSPMEQLGTQALERCHIFCPTSSAQLAATLHWLPAYHISHIPSDEIGLIAIDSISSFYWLDRFTVEQMRSVPPHPGQSTTSFIPPLRNILTTLEKLSQSHGAVAVLTNWGLNPLSKVTDDMDLGPTTLYKQHLQPFPCLVPPTLSSVTVGSHVPPIFNATNATTSLQSTPLSLAHHITLPPIPTRPFRPGIPFAEAKAQEEKHRFEAVDKGEVVGIVRTSGSACFGRFTFRISHDEVLV